MQHRPVFGVVDLLPVKHGRDLERGRAVCTRSTWNKVSINGIPGTGYGDPRDQTLTVPRDCNSNVGINTPTEHSCVFFALYRNGRRRDGRQGRLDSSCLRTYKKKILHHRPPQIGDTQRSSLFPHLLLEVLALGKVKQQLHRQLRHLHSVRGRNEGLPVTDSQDGARKKEAGQQDQDRPSHQGAR